MIFRKALKYPVLIIGIIFFTLYLLDPKTSEYWSKHSRRFIPSTCDALVDRAEPKADEDWSFSCPGTQLLILKIPVSEIKDEKFPATRVRAYKLLANSLVKLSQISNPETMEFLQNIKVILEHSRLKVLAKTDGNAVNKFIGMTDQDKIAEHLKLTVKIKEFR